MMGKFACLALALVGIGCATHPQPKSAEFCNRIEYISEFPVKHSLSASDEVYLGLMAAGSEALPCLRERVGDSTLMKYPSSMPGVDTVAVGDLAFFIWWRISGAKFEELFPKNVADTYGQEGISSYFSYVAVPGNRARLMDTLAQWEKRHLREPD